MPVLSQFGPFSFTYNQWLPFVEASLRYAFSGVAKPFSVELLVSIKS